MYRLNSKKEDFIVRESGFLKVAKEVIQKDGSDLERIDKNESKPHRYFFRKIGFSFSRERKLWLVLFPVESLKIGKILFWNGSSFGKFSMRRKVENLRITIPERKWKKSYNAI